MQPRIFLLSFILSVQIIYGQVGIGTNAPNSNALLHLESNNKGVLFPRMTAVQRSNIPPVNGLVVFDLDSSCLYIYQVPSGWKPIKALGSLKDLISGNANSDVLLWNGSEWENTSLSNLFGLLTNFFNFFYRDKDGDGFGDKYLTVMTITAPDGYVSNNNDCNDDNIGVGNTIWYRDQDGDGYGTTATTLNVCAQPIGYVLNGNDCNDNNAAVNPGVVELTSNGIDDDCDGLIDEPSSVTDLPDDSFFDANGDGIDGTEANAIFVSSTGIDANPGTKAQPKRTITAGITTAVANGKDQVYVGNGTYAEKVVLVNGISVYGGYSSANWSRSATNIATITGAEASGRRIGIEGINIISSTTIDRLRVLTSNATSTGTSNYGMYCNNCDGVTLKNSNIQSGNGGVGLAGSTGSTGQMGLNGGAGGLGSCDFGGGAGGAGGNSPCSRFGGNGGFGGGECACGGSYGANGTGGALGGAGGAGCSTIGCAGSPGSNGANASVVINLGTFGNAGSGGSTVTGFWVGGTGGNGGSGFAGYGGGGGGGGGGQGGAFADDGGGNGGGGGGGGGCAGGGGIGGTGGGGSFGIFLYNSTGIQLIANTITSGSGGAGGSGGNLGSGGAGGTGGNGGNVCTSEVGAGGRGGNGSAGSAGGYGGGGAGGPSWGVYRVGTTVTTSSNFITAGFGGPGGNSNGNDGVNGASGTVN